MHVATPEVNRTLAAHNMPAWFSYVIEKVVKDIEDAHLLPADLYQDLVKVAPRDAAVALVAAMRVDFPHVFEDVEFEQDGRLAYCNRLN
jgi:hypothetical protein